MLNGTARLNHPRVSINNYYFEYEFAHNIHIDNIYLNNSLIALAGTPGGFYYMGMIGGSPFPNINIAGVVQSNAPTMLLSNYEITHERYYESATAIAEPGTDIFDKISSIRKFTLKGGGPGGATPTSIQKNRVLITEGLASVGVIEVCSEHAELFLQTEDPT